MNTLTPCLLAQTAAPTGNYALTPAGWVTMALSVGFVTFLLGWCIWKVRRESSPEKLQGPLEIDTRDTQE
mgnify:CR=1 FL=1